jgi:polyketide biosynthesis enoyl-CoA hydratase PksH
MGTVSVTRPLETLRVRSDEDICYIQIHRPEVNNAIGGRLIEELTGVLDTCEDEAKIVVLEGTREVFCPGADFAEIQRGYAQRMPVRGQNPDGLYALWARLAFGPYVTIAHVRGKANAGALGFISACDMVLSDETAQFSLSEMLFGLMPACVLPFLIRRIGSARANYLTLLTQPIPARQAREWGLVDACEADSDNLLRKQLLRLRRLGKPAIASYKRYLAALDEVIVTSRPKAVEANVRVFSDPGNIERIARYVQSGQFPWE